MTTCADSTALRAHLDHPEPRLEAHLDDCEVCTGLLTAIAVDAGVTRRALAALDAAAPAPQDVDTDAALVRALAAAAPAPTVVELPRSRTRRALAAVGPRVAVAASVVVLALAVALTPAGRSAVAQALDGFRGEQIEVVAFDPTSLQMEPQDLQALASLGDLDLAGVADPSDVADMAAAEAIAGISGPALADTPDRLMAGAPGRVSLTLVARDGNGVPAALDGSVLQASIPGVIGAVYGDGDRPQMVVGRSGLLQIDAVGAPLEDIRAFLLSREELPADLRAQLAAIEDWQSTLPIPVPVDGPGWVDVTIDGRPGVAFGDGSGLGTLVLRDDADGITVVGGMIPVEDALAIAADA